MYLPSIGTLAKSVSAKYLSLVDICVDISSVVCVRLNLVELLFIIVGSTISLCCIVLKVSLSITFSEVIPLNLDLT